MILSLLHDIFGELSEHVRGVWCVQLFYAILVCIMLCTVVRVCRHSITLSLQLLLFVHGETTWRRLASPADNRHERTDNTLLLYTRLAPSLSFHLHHFLSHTLLLSFTLPLHPLSTPLQSCHSVASEISITISYPVIYPVFHYSLSSFPPESKWKVLFTISAAQFSGSFNFSFHMGDKHTHITEARTYTCTEPVN